MRRLYRNLPITLKVMFLVFVMAVVFLAKETTYMYLTLRSNVEKLVGTRMEFVARTAALVVNGDIHQKIVRAYMDRDPQLTEREDFKRIQRILRRIQRVNELGSDIYTLIRPQWKPDSLIFVTMSDRKTYVGNSVPLNPHALATLNTGKPTYTHVYEDAKGSWISAYAPIRNRKDAIVGLVAIDYRVDGDLAATTDEVIRWAGLPSAGLLVVFLVLAAAAGRSLSSPLRDLTEAVQSAAQGESAGYVSTSRRDEIGTLSQALNAMVELSGRAQMEAKSRLKTLEAERESLQQAVQGKEREIKRTNQAYQALLGKLAQGCFIFLKDGRVLPQYSKVCEELLETAPDKQPIWALLQMDKNIGQAVLDEIFAEEVPVHQTLEKLPKRLKHSRGTFIQLTYHPLRNANKQITGVVTIAEIENESRANDQAPGAAEPESVAEVKLAERLVKFKPQFAHYMRNTRAGLHLIGGAIHNQSVLKTSLASDMLGEIQSGAALFALHSIETCARDAAAALEDLTSNPESPKFVDRFEEQVASLSRTVEALIEEIDPILGLELNSDDHKLEISHRELLDFSKQIVKAESTLEIKKSFDAHFVREPIERFIGHYAVLVEQFAEKTGKQVHPLKISGGEIRIVAEPYLELLTTLLHPIRNALHYGIETPAERLAAGKDRHGSVGLHFALTEGSGETPGWLFITVEDDGMGINPKKIRGHLAALGEKQFAEQASDFEIMQQLLREELATGISDHADSRRGEGLHLLLQSAKQLGGNVEIVSVAGKGTQIAIMVPYREEAAGSPSPLPLIDAA